MKTARRLVITLLVSLLMLIYGTGNAQQNPPKDKDADKPPSTTTVDAWRQALPQSEVAEPPGETAINDAVEESATQIEQRLDRLERGWMEAVKLQDAATLKRIIADDFTLAGDQPTGALLDRTRYLAGALRDLKLNAYSFDSLTVRLYGDTAVVSAHYKQQATVAGKEWSGEFLVTDVWVKRGKRWHAVARHISQTHSG